MLKLVDKHGLEPCAARRAGSIPVLGTQSRKFAKMGKMLDFLDFFGFYVVFL